MTSIWRPTSTLLACLWWLALCYLPFSLFSSASSIQADIGCAANGECYLPGAVSAQMLKAIAIFVALLVWPAAAAAFFRRVRRFRASAARG